MIKTELLKHCIKENTKLKNLCVTLAIGIIISGIIIAKTESAHRGNERKI